MQFTQYILLKFIELEKVIPKKPWETKIFAYLLLLWSEAKLNEII